MKLVDKYIAKSVLAAIGLVTLMLAGLQLFILFVNQLGDIGRVDFGLVKSILFVLLQMPYQVYLFFPMASLLGSLIGLGILANNRELIVMRAAGMSIGQITLAVMKAALIVIFLVSLIGETVVPELAHYANDMRMQALSGGQSLRTASGVWIRAKNDFINIGSILPDNVLENVYQFHFDKDNKMRLTRKIGKIEFIDGVWQAKDIAETLINDNNTKAQNLKTMVWDIKIKPAILRVSSSTPDEMTLNELRRFVQAQKKNHQNAADFQLAYWQRLVQPFTTMVMMLLAIPFIFGPLRSSTMGSKLLAGATVGFGFHIINRFFGPLSQVFQLPPVLAVLGPTLIFALLGIYLMRRAK